MNSIAQVLYSTTPCSMKYGGILHPQYITIKLIRTVDTSLQNAPIGSIRVIIQQSAR